MKAMLDTRIAPVAAYGALLLLLVVGCGKSPYDNPIANDSQQPDKILFDKSVENIERHRYELARNTLQTLINTYPDSEYIAKAKLAIADSWYREGTSEGMAQAEARVQGLHHLLPKHGRIGRVTAQDLRDPLQAVAEAGS